MPAVYDSDLQGDRMQLVSDRVAGLTPAASTGTPSAGKLVIMSAANVDLAEIELETPEPFSRTAGVLTLAGVPLTVAGAVDGTAAKAEFRDNADNVVISGLTVGTSGADVLVTNTTVTLGEDVTVVGFTLTHG
jgi:hypothetical protein